MQSRKVSRSFESVGIKSGEHFEQNENRKEFLGSFYDACTVGWLLGVVRTIHSGDLEILVW